MPWSPEDAKRHTKKATGDKAKQWSKVANSELKSGKSEGDAVRIANGIVRANHSPSQRKDRKS